MKYKTIIILFFLLFVMFSCRKKCIKEDIYPQITKQELYLLFSDDSLITIPYFFIDTIYYRNGNDTIDAVVNTDNNFAPENIFENCKRHYFFRGKTFIKFNSNKIVLTVNFQLTKKTSCENKIISTYIYVEDTANNIVNSHLYPVECDIQNSSYAIHVDTLNNNNVQDYIFYFQINDSVCKIKTFAYSTNDGFLYFSTIDNDSLVLINQ